MTTNPAGAGARPAMTVVYALEEPPDTYSKALFAAGPTPRSAATASWRPAFLDELTAAGYDGVVFVPEARDGVFTAAYDHQVAWERRALNLADVICFWVPRDMATMPALTTNVEFGTWASSGKVVFGAPPGAPSNRYLRSQAATLGVPTADTLPELVAAALAKLGGGCVRTGAEREVPAHIWATASFQGWYRALVGAGNTLCGASVAWSFATAPERPPFLWALHVDVYVAAEGRRKTNEVVLSRPDISAVVAYRRGRRAVDTEVVLVSEFRSTGSSIDGYVWELPSGSTDRAGVSAAQLASDELAEETGIVVKPSRLRSHGGSQLCATLSAHRSALFSVELTEAEMAGARGRVGSVGGSGAGSERTHLQVARVGDLRGRVDFSMLGMIMAVLGGAAAES